MTRFFRRSRYPVPNAGATHEIRLFSLLANAGFSPKVIYDIGASDGSWSVLVRSVFPDASYHLFEPLAEALEGYKQGLQTVLRENPRFSFYPIALGNRTGPAVMSVNPDGVSSTSIDMGAHPDFQTRCEVSQYQLDEFVATRQLPLPDLIKLDTQATEHMILSCATRALEHATLVFVETWFDRGYGPETPLLTEISSLLDGFDYQLVELGHRFYDADHRLYGCDAFYLKRPFLKKIAAKMPAGSW